MYANDCSHDRLKNSVNIKLSTQKLSDVDTFVWKTSKISRWIDLRFKVSRMRDFKCACVNFRENCTYKNTLAFDE